MKSPNGNPETFRPEISEVECARADDTLKRARSAAGRLQRMELRDRLAVVRRFREAAAVSALELARWAVADSCRSAAEVLAAEVLPLLDACRFLERQAAAILKPRKHSWRHRPLWLWGAESLVERYPYGVVMVIAPSNYPLLLPGVQLLQAFVAGNAVILKPGVGGAPAAAVLLDRLMRAGLEQDALQLLPESPGTASAILDRGVDKFVFTGSARIGVELLKRAAPNATPAVMELSGSDAAIIRADADLHLAAEAIAFGLRLNQGRTCIAPRRVIIARPRATEFEGLLVEALKRCAPVRFAHETSAALHPVLEEALSSGAHLLSGRMGPGTDLTGPVAAAGVPPHSPLLSEDFFGPVMCLLTAAHDEESVRLANASPYGLGCSIFTRDAQAASRLAAEVRAGTIVINDLIAPTADPRLPFGGCRLSGFGSTRGPEGLLDLTRPKVSIINRASWRPHYRPLQSGDDLLFATAIAAIHGKTWGGRLKSWKQLAVSLLKRGK